jgi:uncharacterized membrane protein YkvA (DUF1232 family)
VSRMIRALFNGRYKHTPWRTLVLFAVAVIYVVSPVDFIPDYIPVIGFIDDLALFAFFLRSLQKDVRRFVQWEKEHGHTL